MPELPTWFNYILALIAGLGGLAGIAALINSITAAKKVKVNALEKIVLAVQAENTRLRTRMSELEIENKGLRERNQKLEGNYRWAQREIVVLRDALLEAGIEVPEFRPQNE